MRAPLLHLTLRSGKEQRERDWWRGNIVVAEERTINGWQVLLEGKPRSYAAATLLGNHRVVRVSAILDERLRNTELSRWVDIAFREAIEAVCEQNDVNIAGTNANDTSPSNPPMNPPVVSVTRLASVRRSPVPRAGSRARYADVT
jgi:hypothetical protein